MSHEHDHDHSEYSLWLLLFPRPAGFHDHRGALGLGHGDGHGYRRRRRPPPVSLPQRQAARFAWRSCVGKEERYWMGWPGASYDIDARQADYTKTMADAAAKLGVELEVDAEPIADMAGGGRAAGAVQAVAARRRGPDRRWALHPDFWPHAERFLAERGDIPTIVFSPMGTSFTGQLAEDAQRGEVLRRRHAGFRLAGHRHPHVAHDLGHEEHAAVHHQRRQDRGQAARRDRHHAALHPLGALDRGAGEARSHRRGEGPGRPSSPRTAKKIVEPTPEDVINAAKTYVVAKRIMAAENCQGISLNCLGLIGTRPIPCPPCMAWQTLNDEGSVGICECDWNAGISLRLCALLTGPARLHAGSRPEHGQRHADGRPLHFGHQAPRFRPAGRADDPAQPQRVGPRHLAASALAGGRAGHGDEVRRPEADHPRHRHRWWPTSTRPRPAAAAPRSS